MERWEQPVGCCETGYACTVVKGRGIRCTRSYQIDQAKGKPCQRRCGDLPWNEQPARCCAEGLMCNKEIKENSYRNRCRPRIQAKCRRKWSESVDNTECGHTLVSDSKVLCGRKNHCCIPSAGTHSNKSQHVAFGPADQPLEASCCSGKAKPWKVGDVEKMVCVDWPVPSGPISFDQRARLLRILWPSGDWRSPHCNFCTVYHVGWLKSDTDHHTVRLLTSKSYGATTEEYLKLVCANLNEISKDSLPTWQVGGSGLSSLLSPSLLPGSLDPHGSLFQCCWYQHLATTVYNNLGH